MYRPVCVCVCVCVCVVCRDVDSIKQLLDGARMAKTFPLFRLGTIPQEGRCRRNQSVGVEKYSLWCVCLVDDFISCTRL